MAKVEADIAAGKPVGVRGTPAFLINGVFMSGAQPLAKFEAEVKKQLAAAKALIASGTPKDKVYVALSNKNKKKGPAAKPDKPKKRQQPVDDKTVWKVPVLKTDPVKGKNSAIITIVEFSEYQCPFCTRVLPTLNKIMDTYGDKVRVVWKDNPLPFHKQALPAAIFAREAGAQKGTKGFWAAHDYLFANQKKLKNPDWKAFAKELGLDAGKIMKAIESKKFEAEITAAQDIANDFGARGTPHFFVNGRRVKGAQPFPAFKSVIDEELKKAEGLLKRGVKPGDIYAEATKNGKEPPPPATKDVGPAPDDAPFKGNKNAKIVIQEFSDFQCPFCGRVNGTLNQVLKNFGDKVKIVWRHKPLPFHKDAPLAHEATIEAFKQKGNDGFWKFHDMLFAGQKTPGMKRPQLETYAEKLGLDMAKFKKALDDRTHKAAVEADIASSTKGGIGGTPAFVINGYFVNGAQPYGNFKKMIKLAMKDLKEGKGPKTKKAPTKKAAAAAKPARKPAPKPAPKPAAKPAPKPAAADDAY